MDHELTDVVLELGKLWLRMRHIVGWPWHELQGLTLSVDNLLVANCQELVWLARQVNYRGEFDISSVLVHSAVSFTDILTRVQVVEVDVAVLTTSRETHVICEPVDAHNALHVTLELHSLVAVVRVKVVHMD